VGVWIGSSWLMIRKVADASKCGNELWSIPTINWEILYIIPPTTPGQTHLGTWYYVGIYSYPHTKGAIARSGSLWPVRTRLQGHASTVKVKGRVWGLFGTAACRPIVPLPPNDFPTFITRGATHHIGTRDLCQRRREIYKEFC
jgi:hypothetical protein